MLYNPGPIWAFFLRWLSLNLSSLTPKDPKGAF